jgi:DNA (cytosine-5)-methyltransferase 1
MTRPRLLDLFCGAGGAAYGYHLAGFDVVGVDIAPQPNYPFKVYQADACAMVQDAIHGCWHESYSKSALPGMLNACLGPFDVIHASPPCQDYSVTASLHTTEYPRLIAPVRELLTASGKPYIIENVEGARRDLHNPVKLCGSSFGLGVRRHRLFETSWPVMFPPQCAHHLQPEPIDVTGTGGPSSAPRTAGGGQHRKPRNLEHAREVMGMSWGTRQELAEAVPPAFAEWLGLELMAHLGSAAA